MRDKQQRAGKAFNGLLNPLAGQNIQMVGRLVEHEHIERIVHQLAQTQTAFFAAGQLGYRLECIFAGELESSQTIARSLRGYIFFINQGVYERAVLILKMNDLRQIRGFESLALFDCAAVCRLTSQNNVEQCRFAGAIVAQDCHAFAVLYAERDVVQDLPTVKALADAAHFEHIFRLIVRISKLHGHLFLLLRTVCDRHARDALINGERTLVHFLGAPLVHLARLVL